VKEPENLEKANIQIKMGGNSTHSTSYTYFYKKPSF